MTGHVTCMICEDKCIPILGADLVHDTSVKQTVKYSEHLIIAVCDLNSTRNLIATPSNGQTSVEVFKSLLNYLGLLKSQQMEPKLID